MRNLFPWTLAAAVLIAGASPSEASMRSYCAAFARDQAESSITAGSILSTARPRQPELTERRHLAERAFANCLALYAPKTAEPPPEAEATASPEITATTEAAAPSQTESAGDKKADPTLTASVELVPGSEAWNDYCAAKYASFNRETGTYTSFSGKERPCLVTRN